MGIPRKGSRLIEVDGKQYRYLIKESNIEGHKDQKELSVTVQEDTDKPGNVVQFRVGYGAALYPRDIEYNIREAQKKGWNPSKRGSAIRLDWKWID
jgi:hypothetical protein